MEANSEIESGDKNFDSLYQFTREMILLGRREYQMPSGRMMGYISADTWHFDGLWLRDWIYGLPAYRLWEREMSCGLDRFLERQSEKGMIPDGISRAGETWRVGLESDVEYIFILGVWETWKVTGDDAWLQRCLPAMERALDYVLTDSKHWDAKYQLVKRQHSCDTWDFDIDGAGDGGQHRHVIATCDQSGYFLAFCALSQIYRYLGKNNQADFWEEKARSYRETAVKLLYDGQKFLHHIHLDPIEHGDFDEADQLAMGNTWAMSRGLASSEQARSIIAEYRRRHQETGDAYPWWSLQPGYPDELGYFHHPYLRQGGYANGGLMPWVGGELCRAAFLYGEEKYGVELLRQYAYHVRRTGQVQVWYWPDGTPGFRTANEVGYAGWGMAQWLQALFEGLAGISDLAGRLEKVVVSPRWAAAGVSKVYVCLRYGAGASYLSYRMQINEPKKQMEIMVTGSGRDFLFRVLLPETWEVKSVKVNGSVTRCLEEKEGRSRYAVFACRGGTIFSCQVTCEERKQQGS
ncbi:MAG TPA: hypothetical protein PKW42_03200 [bacterium]|nr:hypothetical protein [bacterium]